MRAELQRLCFRNEGEHHETKSNNRYVSDHCTGAHNRLHPIPQHSNASPAFSVTSSRIAMQHNKQSSLTLLKSFYNCLKIRCFSYNRQVTANKSTTQKKKGNSKDPDPFVTGKTRSDYWTNQNIHLHHKTCPWLLLNTKKVEKEMLNQNKTKYNSDLFMAGLKSYILSYQKYALHCSQINAGPCLQHGNNFNTEGTLERCNFSSWYRKMLRLYSDNKILNFLDLFGTARN